MDSKILIEFAIGGGIPPATSILLRINQDGDAVAVVGNTWPEKGAIEEAGLYFTGLPLAKIEAFDTFISAHHIVEMADSLGTRPPDSLFNVLILHQNGQQTKLKWGFFASVPPSLNELRTQLYQVLSRVRRYPRQVVKAELKPGVDPIPLKPPVPITFELRNIGTHEMQLSAPRQSWRKQLLFKALAVDDRQASGDQDELPAFFHRSQMIDVIRMNDRPTAETPVHIRPGERLLVRGVVDLDIDRPGVYRLFGFVETDIELVLDDQPFRLESLLIAQPVEIRMS